MTERQRMERHRFGRYLQLTRPFTLLPPMVGMATGAVTALGALAHREGVTLGTVARELGAFELAIDVGLGVLLAAALNAGSNIVNQWTDLASDRINKPHRPLAAETVSPRGALALALVCYAAALLLAAFIAPQGRHDTLVVVAVGAAMTLAYSVPPVRLKRFGTVANVTIAVTRGCLLKVAGWSCVAGVWGDPEPWLIGGVFALFLVGAAATKDFADVAGDRAAGCRTWPIAFGPRRAAIRIAPFLIVPWLVLPIATQITVSGRSLLNGGPIALITLGLGLAAYGAWIARSILADPDALRRDENHPAWTHVYVQMMVAQIGLAAAYVAS